MAAAVADKRLDEPGQPPGDLPFAHQFGCENEERNGEKRRMVDAADDLLHDHGIGQRAEEELLRHQRRNAKDEEHLEAEDE